MPYSVVHLYGHDPLGENIGQFRHRLENPIALFANDPEFTVFGLSVFDPDFTQVALACDLLIVHELIRPELEPLMLLRRNSGKPTLYEIADQFLALGSWLPANSAMLSPINQAAMLNLAALSDGIIFSASDLAQTFASLHSVRVVLENNVVKIPEVMPSKPDGFIFGWAGTTTHLADLESIVPEITAFCQQHPDVTFAIMGNRAKLEPIFKAIAPSQLEFRDFGTYEDYLSFLQTLHVGIAPLLPSAFNRGRSDVKFIEYTVCGVASILGKSEVYNPYGGHSEMFGDGAELLAALERLYTSSQARETLAKRALAWVNDHRSPDAIRRRYKHLYRKLLDQKPPAMLPVRVLDGTDLKTKMLQAWAAWEAKNHIEALEIAQELCEQYPQWQQAAYVLMLCLHSLERHPEVLELAGKFTHSIYDPLIAGLAYQAAQKISPDQAKAFIPRLSKVARLRLEMKKESPMVQFESILEHHPYDFFALKGLIHWLQDITPTSQQLPALRQKAALFSLENS